jgi:signal transduction histidine kinase/ligand-binding sensor domain-containing protein
VSTSLRSYRYLAAAVLILISAAVGTASAQYRMTTWTTADGLPQSSVVAVAQTPDGFIWATTLGGLARFDGRTFRTFDTTTNPELPHSRFGGMVVDDEGQLWLTLQTGELVRYVGGKFDIMDDADGLPAGKVLRIYQWQRRLVVETANGTVVWQDGRFVADPAVQVPAEAATLAFAGISAGLAARWYRDGEGRAYRFEGARLTRTVHLPGRAVYEDRSGRVWTLQLGVGGELASLDLDGTRRTYGLDAGQVGLAMLSQVEDPDGTLWFFSPNGLARFRAGRFRSFTTADGLPDNYVRFVFRDREGTHWVGTNTGLTRLVEQPIVSFTVADGLAADNTYPLLQDRQGAIWIGGWPGLTRYHNGVFERVSERYNLISQNRLPLNVLSLMEARDGAIWVGAVAGLRRIHGDRVETIDGPWNFTVHVLYEGSAGEIWIGTDNGLLRYRDGGFTRISRADQTTGGETSSMYIDRSGTHWVGNIGGLARLVDGVLHQVVADEGFTGKRVRAIHQDASGTLWFGTYDTGLFMYRDGRFTRFTVREGLPTNGAFRIIEDEQARFWISSNVGIYRVDRASLEAVASGRQRTVTAVLYGREDGMASAEANGLGQPSGIRARDGRLWFPTQRGVAIIDPASMTLNTTPPPVTFLDISIGGFARAERDRIEIRSGSTEFQARYAALTFVRPEQARFKYRMEGIDPDWVEAGTDRTARYAALPYGTFTFRVIAANRDGVWNEEGASVTIAVVPPFYRTTWFLSLMVVLAATTAYGGHRRRLAGIQRKQAVQQAFARQLLDSQELDRKRIASELHDGVSQTLVVIRNWARMGAPSAPDDSPTGKRLGDIAEAASQALGEVRHVVHDLLPLHLERMGFVEAVRDAAARVSDASGITITCRFDAVDRELSTETALRLFRVAQEGLNNVVKHSGATRASIEVTLEPAHVRLTIQDNGKGFDPGDVSPTSAGDGFGLVGMAERARMMGGDLTITSAPGRGTTIMISVPRASERTGHPGERHAGNANDSNSDR